MHHIKQRSIVFVYKNYDLPTRLLISTFYQTLQPLIDINIFLISSIDSFTNCQLTFQLAY